MSELIWLYGQPSLSGNLPYLKLLAYFETQKNTLYKLKVPTFWLVKVFHCSLGYFEAFLYSDLYEFNFTNTYLTDSNL